MEVLYTRCCGLDVHKSSVSACVLVRERTRTHKKYCRFSAMTHDLGGAGSLASRAGSDSRCHGVDRRVLEAGLKRSRRAIQRAVS